MSSTAKIVFVSYRFNGETLENLLAMMDRITESLEQAGFEAHSSLAETRRGFFEQRGMKPGQITQYMCRKLPRHDAMLVIVKSEDKSEGMLLEVGYRNALADHDIKYLPLILAVKEGVHTCMREIADTILEFKDLDDLCGQLSSLTI